MKSPSTNLRSSLYGAQQNENLKCALKDPPAPPLYCVFGATNRKRMTDGRSNKLKNEAISVADFLRSGRAELNRLLHLKLWRMGTVKKFTAAVPIHITSFGLLGPTVLVVSVSLVRRLLPFYQRQCDCANNIGLVKK